MGGTQHPNQQFFPQAKQAPEWQKNTPTISTQMNSIKFGNPNFSGIKITETTSLSPLNNHKFQSICSDYNSSQNQIKAKWSFRDYLALWFLTVCGAQTPLQVYFKLCVSSPETKRTYTKHFIYNFRNYEDPVQCICVSLVTSLDKEIALQKS